MTYSQHAQQRCQQRGISADYVMLLGLLGAEVHQKGGSYVLQLDKDTKKSLTKRLKRLLMQVQRDIYVVVTENDKVITAAHKI